MNNTNAILSANGGLHSKRAMKKVKDRLQNHGMKRAILVQFVLTGSQSVQVYRDTYNDIADHIRDNGSRCEYFGCLEMDENKGLHAHVYFVIETSKKFPHKTLDVTDGAWLHKLADRRELNRIHIAQPQNKMHNSNGKKQFFARLDDEAKLSDCLERIEYLYKNRSKENVPSREIYFNSNFEANKAKRAEKKKPISPIAALPAAKENAAPIPTLAKETQDEGQFETQTEAANSSPSGKASYSTEASASNECRSSGRTGEAQQIRPVSRNGVHATKGDEMQLTEAGFNYLARQYETCVDQGLNVVEIQHYLSSKGISRSLRQVKHELDSVFCFAGYASQHPAPPRDDLVRLDAAIDRTPLRSSDSWLSRVYSREPSKLNHKPSSIGLTVSELPTIIEPSTQLSQFRSYPA